MFMCGSSRFALKSWGSVARDVRHGTDVPQRQGWRLYSGFENG